MEPTHTPTLDRYSNPNDYNKYADGNKPASTTSTSDSPKWYTSLMTGAATVGTAYFGSLAAMQLADEKKKANNIKMIIGLIVLLAILFWAFKSKKKGK